MKLHCCDTDKGCGAHDCDQEDCRDCECGCSRCDNGVQDTCQRCGQFKGSVTTLNRSWERVCRECMESAGI